MRHTKLNLPAIPDVFDDRTFDADPMPLGAVPLTSHERAVLSEQAQRDGLVIAEHVQSLTTADAKLAGEIVNELDEQPVAFALRFIQLEQTVQALADKLMETRRELGDVAQGGVR